ncbi:MAG TPA: metallophosphoesterase [Longimicrobium sp.]|jgi:hypothetical protein|uniref:metallophosphoesterase family protein n=1 Tax=Longimicrobium sp. TaxID=2029185 RepID=UPI002ED8CE1F
MQMQRWMRGVRLGCVAALLAVLPGCGLKSFGLGSLVPGLGGADSVALNLVLIGDAGLPNPSGEPVLKALRDEIAKAPNRSYVVYLGDNIYPVGLEDTTTAQGKEGLRILRAQMAPLLETGTRGLFVPGNHDWGNGIPEGWAHVRREERFINLNGNGIVGMEPRGGCPGPVVVDVDNVVRLVALDTHWWLHAGDKPGRGSDCRPNTEAGIVDSVRAALASAGPLHTVVVAHHPFVSGGQHGGYFDWPTYLFPLHPWARLAGLFARQDVTGREYRNMTVQLSGAFAVDSPLVYAAGHEHSLQVFGRRPLVPARYHIVSGAGIYGHTTPTRRITGISYIRQASGFQRITFLADGRIRLSVVVVDSRGNAHEDYSTWLVDPRVQRRMAADSAAAAARGAPMPAPAPVRPSAPGPASPPAAPASPAARPERE